MVAYMKDMPDGKIVLAVGHGGIAKRKNRPKTGSFEEGFMKKIYRAIIFRLKVCLQYKDTHKDNR